MEINLNKVIWEGWTVKDFIDNLDPQIQMIMSGRSWREPFKNKKELASWCKDNQPYYKKNIKEVVDYFFMKYLK